MCFKETMKDILVLLALLTVRTNKVCSQPYEADSDGKCRNPTAEYLLDDSDLCCKKCPPGHRLLQMCSVNDETVCQPCDPGQYMQTWNYAKNCLPCNKCKLSKGLQYALNCSYTTRTRCMCQPGMYCMMESEDHCTECRKYTRCKPGHGVRVPGTAKSDVRCEQCPDGMFSDTHSSTDPCRPHTNCHGAAVRKANATSDTVCEREVVTATLLQDTTKEHRNGIVSTNAKTIRSTVFTISDSTLSVRPSVTKEVFNHSTENLLPHKVPDIKLAAAIAGAVGFLLLFIIIILGFLFKLVRKKDAARFHPKLDANGNCESVDEQIISTAGYLEETLLTAFTVNSPEQQCLLEGAGSCSDYSQPSSNTETLTRTDDCNGHESVGPLQSTLALNNPNSCPFLSEPMTLISNAGPVTPQPSGPSQSSSQSSSPQIISPVTTSPHVNVNITFHIGNGSCGTPPVMPMESNNHLPFGEEEQSISIPQQEDGKHSLRSVQDSESYSV
uniref:Tumor necrosis factor receptor superfamily, member 1B n=1 Tax=Scophthalmus maximus TaxID=52904 RepID=A0A8D3AW17_SCOMX